MKKLAYFQGGGGVNEPSPGKTKYKADPAILVQPRFKEPFYRNYDYTYAPGLTGDEPQHSPGSGYIHLNEYPSVQEFLRDRRQQLQDKYVADDFWIEDTPGNHQERISKMQVRAKLLSKITKHAIDYPIDDYFNHDGMILDTSETYQKPDELGGAGDDLATFPTTVGLGDFQSYPYSAQIGGYLDRYLPQDDFEGKSNWELDFGRDYVENAEEPYTLTEDDLERLMSKYLTPRETDLFGLPDGVDPPEDIDPDATVNSPNTEWGTTDIGVEMYPADGLSKSKTVIDQSR